MASVQTVWGIDVGRCSLKAIKLRAADDKVEVVAHEYLEHAKILTQPDADRPELIRTALEKFLSHNDLSKDRVVVSVPGQHTLARFTKLPPVSAKRIPDIVRYEADQQIPFDMDEVIWDYQTFQEEDSPDLEVGIFAMKRELIREHLLHFEQASIEPLAVQCGPLAVYNAAHFDGLLGNETTILLDIGSENADLIIATKDTFWTRTVAIGGNRFTEALVKSFKLSFSKAEGLKRTAESSKYARQIFQAMRPVFADLVQELQRSIGFYSSTHRDSRVEKVICFGNAFKLPGLQKYLQQNLGLPVERFEGIKKATSGGAGALKEEILAFGAAYGLAVQGLDQAKVSSNLLPREIVKQVIWRKKRPAFAAAAACLLLAGGSVWFRQVADMRALAAGTGVRAPNIPDAQAAWDLMLSGASAALPPRARAEAVLAAGDKLKQELSQLGGQGEAERRETERLLMLQEQKSVIPRILSLIHKAVPRGPLADLDTPAAVLAAVTDGSAPPRKAREQLTIHNLFMHYEPDVNGYVWRSEIPVEEPINNPEDPLSAIKLEITLRTPYQGGTGQKYPSAAEFVSETFMNSLRTLGRRENAGLYVDRVFLYSGNKVAIESVLPSTGRAGPAPVPAGRSRGRGGRSFGRTGREAPAAVVQAKTDYGEIDPITHEKLVDDWEFVIWADVILEDAPAEALEADEGGDGEEG